MCNGPKPGIRNIVNPAFQHWEGSAWKDDSDAVGVRYEDDGVTPRPCVSELSVQPRKAIIEQTDAYYQRFDKAVASGRLLVCGCTSLVEAQDRCNA